MKMIHLPIPHAVAATVCDALKAAVEAKREDATDALIRGAPGHARAHEAAAQALLDVIERLNTEGRHHIIGC